MFLTGMLTGMAVLGLFLYINYKNIVVRWYDWALGAVGFGLLLFALQNVFSAGREHWHGTPLIFFLVFGIPALVLIAVAIILPVIRNYRLNSKPSVENRATGK